MCYDAWVQRDEPIWEGGTPLQSSFESTAGAARITYDGTTSNLASGELTCVIGAAGIDGKVARYTSRGVRASSTRRGVRDIDALAPVDDNPGIGGLLAAGVLSGSTFRMGGTSVAAPAVARTIARQLLAGHFDTLAEGVSLARAVRDSLKPRGTRGPDPGIPLRDPRLPPPEEPDAVPA